jgi:putative transposase
MQVVSELSESSREVALRRFHLLQLHLEWGVTLSRIAEEAGIDFRTVTRWLARYRQHGLSGLGRKDRSDRGKLRAVSPTIQRLIEGLALEKPPRPIRSLYRQVCDFAKDTKEPVPSYWMVRQIVQALQSSKEGPSVGQNRSRAIVLPRRS